VKLFDDVQMSIDRRAGNGVYILLTVKELPRFDHTEFVGRHEVSEDDINKKIGLVKGQVFQPQESMRIQKEIKKLYEKEGYLLAVIKVEPVKLDTMKNRIKLLVTIDEGSEVQVDHINFQGNVAFTEGDLRGAMDETSEKQWWKFWSSAKMDRKKYAEDKKKIIEFYQKNGYRDAQILGDSIWYSESKENLNILIRVKEGAQYKVRRITWQGNTVYSADELNQRLGMVSGEIYNQEKFERNLRGNESQSDVASLYLDNGYLRVNLEPTETRVGEDSVDITINVYEMNQLKIGHVNIRGNTKTQEKVIRRELYTRPGDYFSRAAIMRSIRQLSVLNYFNPEKIKPDYNLVDDKTVDLTYDVEEKSSDNINASVGYSGAFGVTGALGFTINNFSLAEPLNGGAGQILNFEWQFGEGSRFRTFSVGFTEPWLMGEPTLLGVTLFDTRQTYGFDLQQTGASVRVGRRFKWPDDFFRGDWIFNVQMNNVRYGQGIYREGKSSQVSITQVIARNSIDNPVFPTYGSNVSLSIQFSGAPLLPGDIIFTKWIFSTEFYIPIFNSSRVALYWNSSYGYLAPRLGSIINPIDQFIMGGTGLGYVATTPLRGYDDQSIGVRVPSGAVAYGNVMTKHTLELRLAAALNPIPIYFLLFAEAGNVFASLSEADFFDLKRSAGFGARLQIQPIGLLGFDYGYGFDSVYSQYPANMVPSGWHFHFQFGRGF
ncbi:MAG TPA: outer membrane protein assembly factor BamA, partial [Bacteroidota bacterium]|nr:outer membrane protein assembly factor BamA [Bacteroidota bacterium]